MLLVNEIFYSLQGESTYTGCPCVFVRLTGCNLRCAYCDTRYAYEEGRPIALHRLVKKIGAFSCGLVEITGGEPLLQAETPALIRQLLQNGYHVLLETNGSKDISVVDDQCVKIVDIKCPSSGEHASNDFKNLERLTPHDEVKFVVADRRDYDYAKEIFAQTEALQAGVNTVHFSPAHEQLAPQKIAAWILEDHLPVRLHLQLHKILWGKEKRGV